MVCLVAYGHTFLHQACAPFGVNADSGRVMRRYRIIPEDPAHVMEQLGCRQHHGRITELVEAVEEELSVLVALGG